MRTETPWEEKTAEERAEAIAQMRAARIDRFDWAREVEAALEYPNEPTKSQRRGVREAIHYALDYGSARRDRDEIKKLRLSELPHARVLSLVLEVGKKGDEGTAAELLCRSRGHVFIGRRGGFSTIARNGKKIGGRGALLRAFAGR